MATKRTALANAARTTFHDEELVNWILNLKKKLNLETFGLSKVPSSIDLSNKCHNSAQFSNY